MLTDFYIQMLLWLETGENPYGFHESFGLCDNLKGYCCALRVDSNKVSYEISMQFAIAGLDNTYPFNSSLGELSYEEECRAGKLYENESRLNWIKQHAAPVQTLPSTN